MWVFVFYDNINIFRGFWFRIFFEVFFGCEGNLFFSFIYVFFYFIFIVKFFFIRGINFFIFSWVVEVIIINIRSVLFMVSVVIVRVIICCKKKNNLIKFYIKSIGEKINIVLFYFLFWLDYFEWRIWWWRVLERIMFWFWFII